MSQEAFNNIRKMIGLRYTSHPWHGISIGKEAPDVVRAFIEVIPSDTVKYEVDKATGYLKIDRPQKFSNIVPALYGFIPQTWCKERVAEFCMSKTGRNNITGDDDPLDICVLTEREVYGQWQDISQLPPAVINRLQHYFLTYKQRPGEEKACEITHIYGREEALEVIRRSQQDYNATYGDLESSLSLTLFQAFNLGQKQQNILKNLE